LRIALPLGCADFVPLGWYGFRGAGQSGHYFASANLPKTAIQLTGEDSLTWYQSSEKVRRGFCSKCGAWLFWEPVFRDWTSVALGSIDEKTGLHLERHIFVAHKGDYYAIGDGLPQNEN
jgi:hypothetical protein